MYRIESKYGIAYANSEAERDNKLTEIIASMEMGDHYEVYRGEELVEIFRMLPESCDVEGPINEEFYNGPFRIEVQIRETGNSSTNAEVVLKTAAALQDAFPDAGVFIGFIGIDSPPLYAMLIGGKGNDTPEQDATYRQAEEIVNDVYNNVIIKAGPNDANGN